MPRMEFEPTIPVFEPTKTVYLYGFREWWMIITDHFRYNMKDKNNNELNFIIIKIY
jgi:hypothetical protein